MSLEYEECLIAVSRSEVLGAVRQSISKVDWEIVEESAGESGFRFFCLERPRSFLGRLLGTPVRFSVSVEDFERWARVRLAAWPVVWSKEPKTTWAIWEVLNSRPQLSSAPGQGDDGAPQQAPIPTYRALNLKPSWLKWARFTQIADLILAVVVFPAVWVFGLDRPRTYLFVAVPLLWVVFLCLPLAFDLVPRHFLKISCRRGFGASLLGSVVGAVILTIVVVVIAYLES